MSEPGPIAHRLGYAGLIPFVAGAALVWLVHADAHPYVVDALSKYGAVIVSFLGGIHWGYAMREGRPEAHAFAWGIVPSLLAWIAALMPAHAGLAALGFVLVACWLVDRRIYPRHGLARWLTLRFRLTLVASLSCFLAAAGS
ncbi:MAG: DUF3429 domain-containing protein [Burkholderiaceae bacterium]